MLPAHVFKAGAARSVSPAPANSCLDSWHCRQLDSSHCHLTFAAKPTLQAGWLRPLSAHIRVADAAASSRLAVAASHLHSWYSAELDFRRCRLLPPYVFMAGAAGRFSTSSASCCGAVGNSGSSGSCEYSNAHSKNSTRSSTIQDEMMRKLCIHVRSRPRSPE